MKTNISKNNARALTLIEVLIVIAILLFAAALYLPTLTNRNTRSPRIACVNNLKQVGLAFRIWAGDNGDKFPMSVSVTNGGTLELIASGTVWRHFQVMSNELNTPKILVCPQDSERQKHLATAWGGTPFTPRSTIAFTGDINTSYFIGVDAVDTNATMFLAGDRNLAAKKVVLPPGLHLLTANTPVSWTRALHENQGNLLMADASVQQFSTAALQKAIENTGAATNRLAIP